MHNAMIVQVGDGGKSGTNEVGSVGLVVGAFATDTIEKLATKGKICDKVYCSQESQGSQSKSREEWFAGLADAQLFIVSK
jgi:hypothetical protein